MAVAAVELGRGADLRFFMEFREADSGISRPCWKRRMIVCGRPP
jgi:hypothetical protein